MKDSDDTRIHVTDGQTDGQNSNSRDVLQFC